VAVDVLAGRAVCEWAAAWRSGRVIHVTQDAVPELAVQHLIGTLDRPLIVLLGLSLKGLPVPHPVKRCGSNQTRGWLPHFEHLMRSGGVAHDPAAPPTKTAEWASVWLSLHRWGRVR
jgi:hypothetical protein